MKWGFRSPLNLDYTPNSLVRCPSQLRFGTKVVWLVLYNPPLQVVRMVCSHTGQTGQTCQTGHIVYLVVTGRKVCS